MAFACVIGAGACTSLGAALAFCINLEVVFYIFLCFAFVGRAADPGKFPNFICGDRRASKFVRGVLCRTNVSLPCRWPRHAVSCFTFPWWRFSSNLLMLLGAVPLVLILRFRVRAASQKNAARQRSVCYKLTILCVFAAVGSLQLRVLSRTCFRRRVSAWLRSNNRLLLPGPCHHSRSKYARVESGISLREMRLDMLQAIRDRSNEVGAGRTSRLRILVSRELSLSRRTGMRRQRSVAARSTASASGLGSKTDEGLNEAVFLPHQVQEIHVVLPRIVRRRRLCLLNIPH